MMRNLLLAFLIILLIPVYLVAYVSIHEIGHTTLARLLGDPEAVYYLIKIDEHSRAIGYTHYDISRLSWGGNLLATLGGILATQTVALAALFLLRLRPENRLLRRIFSILAVTFMLDVPFQLAQALGYRGLGRWPTGVDLMDVILLLHMELDISQLLLKGILTVLAVLYIAGFVWLYKRSRAAPQLLQPSIATV